MMLQIPAAPSTKTGAAGEAAAQQLAANSVTDAASGKKQATATQPGALPVELPKPELASAAPEEAAAQVAHEQKAAKAAKAAAAAAEIPATGAPVLPIHLAPRVSVEAPKPASGAADKGRSNGVGAAAKPATPVTIIVERPAAVAAKDATHRGEPVAAVSPGALPKAEEEPTTTPAKPDVASTQPLALAPAPASDLPVVDKPVQAQQANAAQLHTPAHQIAHRVEKAIESGEERIRIELRPASLGHVEVQLQIADDGRVAAVVSADRPDTLALLQNDARGLEQALKDAGLRTDSGSLSFNLRQGEGQGGHQPDGRGSQRRRSNGDTAFTIEGVGAEAPRSRGTLRGLDIRI
jgi:flagellar hook-length control protein FliK